MNDQIVTLTRPGVRPAASQSTKQESTFPTETINIPSKGWFYSSDSPLSAGTLELKPMTAREEDILTSKNLIQKGIVLDKVLESLIVEKAIHSEDMLNCDRNAAFVAIRRMAYGDEYKANITCPKCGVDNSLTIDLGKMDNKPFDFEKYPKGTNEFEFTLPVSKRVVTFKLLTKKDEDAIDADLKALTKISKEVTSETTTSIKAGKKDILEINYGDGTCDNYALVTNNGKTTKVDMDKWYTESNDSTVSITNTSVNVKMKRK